MSHRAEPFKNDIVIDHSLFCYPARLLCIEGRRGFNEPTSSFYGYVAEGSCMLKTPNGSLSLSENMYFALAGDFECDALGKLVVFQRYGYRVMPSLGGPVERDGRLSYIDNSRASILVHPARLGDPVLNLLVFPPNIRQTPHLHPSSRLGYVIDGDGVFVGDKEMPLKKGMIFSMEPFSVHCFHSGPRGLSVVAFHPDSDVGPTDQRHPMKTRTYTAENP